MLFKLNNEIRECLHNAAAARERADATNDPLTKADFVDMERRWLFLARSYEFTERISAFSGGRPGRRERG
jgi:hypothetical protein